MSLRGTAVPLRRSPSWRRSGDDSHWESLLSAGEAAAPPLRPARPRSVSSEPGPADHWLREPERTRPTPAMPTLHTQEPPSRRPEWPPPATARRTGSPRPGSYSGPPGVGSGSRGGSQEPPLGPDRGAPGERRGSRERARVVQGPAPEQAHLSALAPVRVGWLPVQRRVSGLRDPPQGQTPRAENQPSAQMKMKQPITPILQTSPSNGFRHHEAEAEQREAGSYGLRAGTRCSPEARCSPERTEWSTSEWRTSAAAPPLQQVSNNISVATKGRGPLTWQSLRRGWGFNKISALSGGPKVSPRTPGTEGQPPPPPSTEGWGPHPPLHGSGGARPVGPAARGGGVSRPSPRETASVATTTTTTTLVPHDKVSFSSITICSKKVTRTTSLPPDKDDDDDVRGVAPPSFPGQRPPGAPDSVTLRRKAVIVKVTERRVRSDSFPSATTPARRPSPDRGGPGDGRHGDTVVHRRKATVIKVTELRESYSTAVAPGDRHSYTEDDGVWRQGPRERYVGPPQGAPFQRGPPEDRSGPVAPQGGDPGRGGGGRALHRSTLSLVLSAGGGAEPRLAPPPPARGPLGGGADGPRPRPVSCYGNVFGHTEAAHVAVATKPRLTRMPSCGNLLPREAGTTPPQPGGGGGGGGLLSSTGVPEPNGDRNEGAVHVASRRASLTLLKPPGAGSTRSAQDVLALNAAAIIANIKLQRQLKNPGDGRPAKDAAAAASLHQGNDDGVVGKVEKSNPGQKQGGRTSPDHPQYPEQSPSLKEALERSRPGFIARSQDRVLTLRRRTQERGRRLAARPPGPPGLPGGPGGPTRSRQPPLDDSLGDNLSRRRGGAVTAREEEPWSLQVSGPPAGTSAGGGRSRKEDAKREACLANRRRVELFKKRLLDHILHRNQI